MLRRILIPIEPSIYGENAREVGLRVAAEQRARVTALVVVDTSAVDREVGAVPPGAAVYVPQLRADRLAEINRGLDKLVGEFLNHAAELKVPVKVERGEANPADAIVVEAMFHDLVVMGQKADFDFDGRLDPARRYVKAVLSKGVAPALVLPANVPLKKPQRVLVLFNGSLPAARALQRLPILPWVAGAEVKVLMADTKEEEAKQFLTMASEFLGAHGFTNVAYEWTSASPIKALDAQALEWADLVVAGAHARSVLDFLLGSVAAYLIEQDKRPVMICG